MRSYSLIAPAKINLYLEIIGDRPDGYHELAMVMQTINLCDLIHLRSDGTNDFRIKCNKPEIPTDKTNLAYRAATLMAQEFPEIFARYGGVEITIEKNIPMAAGLAGGSSNAAAVLVGLDLIWELGLTLSELQELGAKLGSDIPFSISGGTALATGRGEKLSPLPDLDNLWVVLAKYKSLEISTVWAYQTYRQQFSNSYIRDSLSLATRQQKVKSGEMVSSIAQKDGKKIGSLLYNDLEKVALPTFPQVLKLRETFAKQDILGTMMSGSGPTVFALTETEKQAQQVKENVGKTINNPDLEIWVTNLSSTGIRLG